MNRRTFLKSSASAAALAALPFPALASAQQAERSATHDLVLDSNWEFYRGPLDGRQQVWHSEELVTWEKVSLPHCFNHYDACDPDAPAYRGLGWYRTRLAVANPYSNGRTLLHVEGAGQQAEVWLGGTKIAEHIGGYDEWMVDITDHTSALKPNEPLQLAILCDNGRNIDRMPSDQSDFTLYGGLYRPVHLIYLPAVSLEAVHTHIDFEPDKPAAISITARLYAPQPATGELDLTITLLDPAGRTVHTQHVTRAPWQGEIELTSTTIKAPKLWSPGEPNLYRCEVTLGTGADTTSASHHFGIRHTRWQDHGPFFLNGQRLLLKGSQRHEDHAGTAAAMSAELIREEFRLLKAMGANIVRLGHYQQRALVLELCDELGLFVWEELCWCRSGIVSETFEAMGKRMLHTLIDQHRNHPSVLIWGLGNEDDWPTEININDHEAIRRYMTELRDLAHAQDPTRMTGYRRGDFVKDIPDVYSPSIWAGWYSGVYTDYAPALEKARNIVPHLLHVEWGADSHAGRFAEEPDPAIAHVPPSSDPAEKGLAYKPSGGDARVSKDGTWTETYACDLFEWYLRTIDNTPWLTGALQWCFKDFTTPLRVENPVPRVNQKGLITRDMQPKEGYFVFQSWWSQKPMLRLFGHNWPVRWGAENQPRLVRVYSNCPEVELFVNGVSAGKRKRDPNDFPCAGLRWNAIFRPGDNELRAVAHTHDGQQLTDTIRFRYETRPWGKPAKLALQLHSLSGNIATVEAELLDTNGVRCLDSRAQVRFALAGNGRLLDNLGTPTGSRVVQLYNGHAHISVATTSPAVISVSTQDLPPAFLTLAGALAAHSVGGSNAS
ncbi:glycoside hydrolase family 2 protein [Bryocella elongata]|nr:glycoside hydrolase family 2 TIM barrel-domain containing protein [Bryocella elongata]